MASHPLSVAEFHRGVAATRTSASPVPATPPQARGRAASVTLWTLQILLGLLFAFAGISKLLALSPEVVTQFARIGAGSWFRDFVGALELAGAIGLLLPRLSGLAALGLAGVMVGAILVHVLVLPPVSLALIPAAFGAVLGGIAAARRSEIRAVLDRIPA